MTPNPPKKPNINVELAKERNRAAAERTLMAWIRTCLSLISFGFGIDRIVAVIARTQMETNLNPVRLSRLLGLAFIAVGTGAMMAAAIEHRRELQHIQREDYFYRHREANLEFRI